MKKISGDLLDELDKGTFQVIIHGANCHHGMYTGIAGQITKRYPKANRADRENSIHGDMSKLSNYTLAHVGDEKIIINLYTQFYPGKDLILPALELGFVKLSRLIGKGIRIGIPAIGCGIAGGDWNIVGPKIAEIMKDHDITYVEYAP